MKLYGLKNCDTCRKALKSLADAGQQLEFVDVRAMPPSAEFYAAALAALGDALVNRRSTTWRGLSEAERNEPPVDLLARHPSLMKRPVIQTEDGALYLGWTDQVRACVIG